MDHFFEVRGQTSASRGNISIRTDDIEARFEGVIGKRHHAIKGAVPDDAFVGKFRVILGGAEDEDDKAGLFCAF